jgi:phosphoesterase RecJ-like protein
MQFSDSEVQKLKELLQTPKKIVITTHFKPDGDAMGSSLGLYNYLIQKGHEVCVVTPSDYPSFLFWLPGNETVVSFFAAPEKAEALIATADLIFCLDFNDISRIEKLADPVANSSALKILIDHHLDPHDFAAFTYSDTACCATCEMIYKFIAQMGDQKLINKAVAECLYTGIMTDTGSFKFASTTAQTHRIIGELIDAGAENFKIHEAIYDTHTLDRLRLLGYSITEKLQVFQEFHTAFISLTEDELNKFNHKTGDTEGIVNYALGIEGIKFAAMFIQRKELIKISFRSKGDFSVKEFSRDHFEGGGHRNASGGRSLLSIDDTLKKFIALLPQYKNQLSLL